MSDLMWTRFDIRDFRNSDVEKYSVWVYMDGTLPKVYADEQPNTEEVWFKFYKFNHFYWTLFEDECIDNTRRGSFYNNGRIKQFMLGRMLHSTNIDSVVVEYGKDGRLTERSLQSVMSVHPRILRVLMDKVDVLPKPLEKEDERELEKQCSILFGKGEGVTNPHEYVTMYCNLVAFWEKFGMNYFDILNLPQDVFFALKKVMTLESATKTDALAQQQRIERQQQQRNRPRGGGSVRF